MPDKMELSNTELSEIENSLNPAVLQAMEEALDEMERVQATKTLSELLVEHIRKMNKTERLVRKSQLKLRPPEGISKEDMARLLHGLTQNPALAAITAIPGKQDTYYYDNTVWTERFAQVQALLEEKDLLSTIATATRHDCKVYPRPLRFCTLTDRPYSFSKDEILGALARMKLEPGYDDIDTVQASNGNLCLYSTAHMSKAYAQALCEYMEVEQTLSP